MAPLQYTKLINQIKHFPFASLVELSQNTFSNILLSLVAVHNVFFTEDAIYYDKRVRNLLW